MDHEGACEGPCQRRKYSPTMSKYIEMEGLFISPEERGRPLLTAFAVVSVKWARTGLGLSVEGEKLAAMRSEPPIPGVQQGDRTRK